MSKKKSSVMPTQTEKQLKFIAAYAGNGVEAARLAGYAGDENVLGVTAFRLLRNPKIRQAIQRRFKGEVEPLIANRLTRQQFWSKIMSHPKTPMRDRLKASELLGKSEADFTDVVKSTGEQKVTVVTVTEDQLSGMVKKLENEC